MLYKESYILENPVWNNKLAFEKRSELHGCIPSLLIPSLKIWDITDIAVWEHIVFEEVENGTLKSCRWLKNFIRLWDSPIPTTIFDNHNHALYFWIEAMHEGILKPGFELIHIDEHSDLWPNEYTLDKDKAIEDLKYSWEFTNFSCNVGNYIAPAKECRIIWNMIRIENEFQVDAYMDYTPGENTVLNIDLDFFAPELDFIDERKKIRLIQNLINKVQCVTIATSPFFIDQKRAIKALDAIFWT
jgi:hypothetical protein